MQRGTEGSLWGYVEGHPVVVGLVVLLVCLSALIYIVLRLTGNLPAGSGPARSSKRK